MKFSLPYLRTWLIIKRKQFLNQFPAEKNSFTKFVILCAPRSGSTWLHTLLNSHPQIVSYGEILRETMEENPNQPPASVNKLVFHPHHASIRAVGLKVFYEYDKEDSFKKSFQEIVNDPSIHIIHLIRKDKAAQFKSLKLAQATQVWSSGKPVKHVQPIKVDSTELETYKNNLHYQEQEITALLQHHPLITIRYEDLLNTFELTSAGIQRFLKVKPRSLFSLLRPQS